MSKELAFLNFTPNRKRQPEKADMKAVWNWTQLNLKNYPDLKMLFHIANEGTGTTTAKQGAELNRMGRVKGVPDWCLPVPRGRFHGLFIEQKAERGRPTKEQKQWEELLNMQGYKAVTCVGWEKTIQTLVQYLNLAIPNHLL
jgi:hypothetical protein